MRGIVSVLAASALLAAMGACADAQSKPAKPRAYAKRHYTQGETGSYSQQSARDGYQQQVADKLRFGSAAWWDQMRREGRLGGETP